MVKIEEIVMAKKPKQGKKKNKSLVLVKSQVVPVPQTQIIVRKKKKNRNRKRRASRSNSSLQQLFIDALRYPDLMGPIKMPFPGCFDRTVLASDTTKATMTGDAVKIVQGVTLYGPYNLSGNAAFSFTSTSETINFGTGTGVPIGVQFPPAANVNDARLNSACILISYTGALLSAGGEVIIGNLPDISGTVTLTGTSYSSLYYQPGTLHVPIASLVDRPLRVCLTHASPEAFQFVTVSTGQNDNAFPFFATSGLPVGQTVVYEVIRNWEVRPVFGTANAIPYSESESGRSADEGNLLNAFSYVSRLPSQVSELADDYASSLVSRLASDLPQMAVGVGALVGSYVTSQRSRVQMARRGAIGS